MKELCQFFFFRNWHSKFVAHDIKIMKIEIHKALNFLNN
jgi:hypothetical protein